jgi:hypothetical protein
MGAKLETRIGHAQSQLVLARKFANRFDQVLRTGKDDDDDDDDDDEVEEEGRKQKCKGIRRAKQAKVDRQAGKPTRAIRHIVMNNKTPTNPTHMRFPDILGHTRTKKTF